MCVASYADMESKVVHWKLEAEEGTKPNGDWQIKLVLTNQAQFSTLSLVHCELYTNYPINYTNLLM